MVQSLKNSGVASATGPKSGLLVRFPASPLVSRPEEGEAVPIRVLIVEDDENYREIVSGELEWHGFAVRSFADGDELLGSLDAVGEADVIVLDWRLPTISGIDLLPELRRRGVTLPVVFLTSHADPAYERLAFERGALDFIDKTRGVEFLARRLRLVTKSGKPAAALRAGSPSSAASSFSGRPAIGPIGTRSMLDSPSANTISFICWCRTSAMMKLTSRSTAPNITKASLPGKGLKDIGQTFDHLSGASAASSAKLIRPLAKSRTRRPADIAGEV